MVAALSLARPHIIVQRTICGLAARKRCTGGFGSGIAVPYNHLKSLGFYDDSRPGTRLEPVPMPMQESSKVVIVDESPPRAAILEEGLREAGYTRVVRLGDTANLLAQVCAIDPDVILIGLENPSREMLEQMFQVTRAVRRPIAMFVDQSDSNAIQASVEAGVSAYVVNGLKKERVKPIVDLCISRFNAFSRLQSELEQTKTALHERKVVDRAKGILMKAKNISEESAYALLRKTAMDEQKKIADVAQAVIVTAELLK